MSISGITCDFAEALFQELELKYASRLLYILHHHQISPPSCPANEELSMQRLPTSSSGGRFVPLNPYLFS
jgi:hypothetical protein